MNGPHDLGGQHGMGPIAPERNEPIFHAEWEKRALGITLSCGAFGAWTLDESRHARESLAPATYLSASYYEIWTRALETLLKRHGFVTQAELDAGHMLDKGREPKRVLTADMVAGVLAKGGPCDRPVEAPPRFAAGDSVRTKNFNPESHTRLPALRPRPDRHGGGRAGQLRLPGRQRPRQGREPAMALHGGLRCRRDLG